jgi:hypothetical protein
MVAKQGAAAVERYWTSGNPAESSRVMSALLDRRVSVKKLAV